MNKRKNNLLINLLKNSFIKSNTIKPNTIKPNTIKPNTINQNIIKTEFINSLNITFNKTNMIVNKFNYEKYFYHNKFIWEYGHLLYHWEHFILKFIINEYKIITNEIYNRHTLKDTIHNLFMSEENILNLNTIRQQLLLVQSNLLTKINNTDEYFYNSIISIIYQGQIYQEFINEKLINIMQYLSINLFSKNDLVLSVDMEPIVKNQIIQIKGSIFHQGYNKSIYDNSKPSFICSINNFAVSKYKITNHMYL